MSRPCSRSIAIVCSTLALAWTASARADDTSTGHLDWSAPTECPTREDLVEAIEALHPAPNATSGPNVVAEVTRDDEGPYRLRLVIRDRDGVVRERSIEGDTCREVFDAAVVVIVLAREVEEAGPLEDSTARPVAPPGEPPRAPPLAPAVVAPAPPRSPRSPPVQLWPREGPVGDRAPTSTPPVRRRAVVDLGAVGGLDFASLPAPAPGFGVGASFEYARNIVELRGVGWVPQSARLGAHPTAGGNIGLYVGSLRYCRSLLGGIFDVTPCGGIEAGALVASPVGVQSPNNGVGPWLSPNVGLMAQLEPTPHLAFSLELEGLAQIFRPRFLIAAGGEVYQPPPVTARAVAGLHVRFP